MLFWGQAILQKNPGGAVTKTPQGDTLSRQGAEGAAAGYDIDYYDLTLVPRDAGHEELQALDLDRLIRK